MRIWDFSGVAGDADLLTQLVAGPSKTETSERSGHLWPEVLPGYFRAGENAIHAGMDYLFAREARLRMGPFEDLCYCTQEIPRVHGPTLAATYPVPSGAAGSGEWSAATGAMATGHPQRTSGWTELVAAPCRWRLLHNLPQEASWVSGEVLADGSVIYMIAPSAEANGWGSSTYPLFLQVRDKDTYWEFLGTLDDLRTVGNPGSREWARTSTGSLAIKRPAGVSPPTNLLVTWIASQVTLDWEEYAYAISGEVLLSVPTRTTITDVTIQSVTGYTAITGYLDIGLGFPRKVANALLPDGWVIVRYRPTGIYGIAPGVSGGVVAARLEERGVVCIRHEEGTPEEPFSGGRIGSLPLSIHPNLSGPGFLIALAPGHPYHPTHPGTGEAFGSIEKSARLLAWANPTTLYPTTCPSRVRILVLGSDGLPLSSVRVAYASTGNISLSATSGFTNERGEAFLEVRKSSSGATGSATLLLSVTGTAGLIDSKSILYSLSGGLTDLEWVNRLRSGRAMITALPGRVRSGNSGRIKLAIWRVQSDGVPSPLGYLPFTVTCDEGRLFVDAQTEATCDPAGGGGKQIRVYPQYQNNSSWFDRPYILEYEPSPTREPDMVRVVWDGGDYILNPTGGTTVTIPTAYGVLPIGQTEDIS